MLEKKQRREDEEKGKCNQMVLFRRSLVVSSLLGPPNRIHKHHHGRRQLDDFVYIVGLLISARLNLKTFASGPLNPSQTSATLNYSDRRISIQNMKSRRVTSRSVDDENPIPEIRFLISTSPNLPVSFRNQLSDVFCGVVVI